MDQEMQNCTVFWNSVKKDIALDAPDKKCCSEWGHQILREWKNANKLDKENQGAARRQEIEEEIIKHLFHCAIFKKKQFAQRFMWIAEAFLESNVTKKMRTMFFRCTMHVIWRNLTVPNEDVRMAASAILLNFYPLLSEDEFTKEEYLGNQHEAMGNMLMDDCVPLRIMAIKKVPLNMTKNWKAIPRETIKSYLEKIVDRLSFDAVPEVRAAVYEGIEHLLPCPEALNASQHSLEILAKRGINDKVEKVRLAAFKMLNKLHGHRYIKLLDLLDMNDVLHRLDFEHSKNVQNQIVRLLVRPFIPQQVDGIDYIERFKRIYFMCKESSNAARHFHHLIYPLGLITMEAAVHHIRSLLLGVKSVLRKIIGSENADDTTDTLKFNGNVSSMMEGEKNAEAAADDKQKVKVAKDVLDSAIILWMAIRYDLFDPKNAQHNSEMTRMMSNILETLNQFPNDMSLMDSALVIARHLPKDKIGRLFGRVKQKLEQEDTKQPHFPHYVEALAAWDMNKLIEIIEKGLKKLRNDLIAVTDPNLLMSTPRRRLCNPLRESPPSKRVKVVDEEDELRRPLELIQTLLACPSTNEELKRNFTVYLEGFFESLCTIRTQFGKLMLMPGWERKFNPNILYAAYETFNIVVLVTKKIEDLRDTNESDVERNAIVRDLPINDRLLYNEMKWFSDIARNTTPSFPVIKLFLRCTNLHLNSGQLTYMLLDEVANMLGEIKQIIEDAYDAGPVEQALKKCVLCLKDALECCDDAARAQRVIEVKIAPLLEYLEDTQLAEADGE